MSEVSSDDFEPAATVANSTATAAHSDGAFTLHVEERDPSTAYELVDSSGRVYLQIARVPAKSRWIGASQISYRRPDQPIIATTHDREFAFVGVPYTSMRKSLTTGTRKPWYRLRNVICFDSQEYRLKLDWKRHVHMYRRKHRDQVLAKFRVGRADETKVTVQIFPPAMKAGPEALLIDDAMTDLFLYAYIHARHLVIKAKRS